MKSDNKYAQIRGEYKINSTPPVIKGMHDEI
jgi:hypothetical protein